MQSYWFSKQSKINIIYNISVITITITMSIILANFGKYAISDCPFIEMLVKNFVQLYDILRTRFHKQNWAHCPGWLYIMNSIRIFQPVSFLPLAQILLSHLKGEWVVISMLYLKIPNLLQGAACIYQWIWSQDQTWQGTSWVLLRPPWTCNQGFWVIWFTSMG